MQEVTLPLTILLTLITAICSVAAAWALTKRTAEAAKETADAANKKASDLERQLAEFKIEAAKRFATDETLAGVRSEVVEAINRLADRLDRVIEGRRRWFG
jgi:hypothetical protein